MRKTIALVAAGLMCYASLPAATTQKKTAPSRKAVAPKTPAPKKSTAVRRTPRTRRTTTAAKTPPRSTWRATQTQPTPERYKQFQEALIKKGYLQGEASGNWDEASADAMRRFQRDQNLEPTGKPNQSLTIIALGLGPKY